MLKTNCFTNLNWQISKKVNKLSFNLRNQQKEQPKIQNKGDVKIKTILKQEQERLIK